MHLIVPARRIAPLACLVVGLGASLGGGLGTAQSTLPATGPTAVVFAHAGNGADGGSGVAGHAANPAPLSSPSQRHAAEVKYGGGQLEVIADNSSLNQILRDIGRATGMTIVGGVEDQPVYGRYGPGSPGAILATLLDGLGSNMLLREATASKPGELILTPRQGGPTPPNPNPPGFDDDAQTTEPPARPGYQPSPASGPVSPAAQGMGRMTSAAASAPPVSEAGAGAGGNDSGTPATGQNTASPNGVRTPEQIYQQLQQLQRAQPQQ